jgi:hypothetical protein
MTNEKRKWKHEGKCHAADEALFVWLKQPTSYNAPTTHSILLQKAYDFGDKLEDFKVKATDGWLTSWKETYGTVCKKLNGEKQNFGGSTFDNWL